MAFKKKANSRTRAGESSRSTDVAIAERQAKAPVFVLGEDLEYRVVRLMLFMGFFVRRARPIFTVAALDQATDLDVLALKYWEPFERETIIGECKSGATGPLDRIFWLSGVKHYVRANRALLVRKGTKWNIKDFAKECGVEVWDLHRIAELESNYKISDSEWPGASDLPFFRTHLDEWNATLRKHPDLWELQLTLSSEVRYDDPFPSVNFLLYQLRLLTRSWKGNATSSLHRYLLSEAISQLTVFLMCIAERSFDLAEEDRKGYIEKGLKYGNVDPKFAERILNSAFNLTRQAVLHYTNQVRDIDRSVFQVPLPPGTPEIWAAIQLVIRHYPRSLSLPQICDLLLSEVFVKENRNRGWLKRIYQYPDLAARVEILREFLRLLGHANACPEEAIASIASSGLENGHRASDEQTAARNALPQQTSVPSAPAAKREEGVSAGASNEKSSLELFPKTPTRT